MITPQDHTDTLLDSSRSFYTEVVEACDAVLYTAMERDAGLSVVLDGPLASRLKTVTSRFPDRAVGTRVSAQPRIGDAADLVVAGLRPAVSIPVSGLTDWPTEQLAGELGTLMVGIGQSCAVAENGNVRCSPQDVALLDSMPGWTVHVPGHPEEVPSLIRSSLGETRRLYLRAEVEGNAAPHAAHGLCEVLRAGEQAVVLAVGPMLDRVIHATAGLDLTVLYTATVRPFDAIGLRTAVLAGRCPDVVLVEPYFAGTSAHCVAEALVNIPHRLHAIGVPRGPLPPTHRVADHLGSHGLSEQHLAAAVRAFLR